ncbi:transporter substrate-binding domain-containing protein [Roseibium salinum]|nr:transporter substrate-binding domain-containing protein [Roseibium salinum]
MRGAHRHDIAPYAYFDETTGTMRGILVDLVNVLDGTGPYTITHNGFPWARAQSMVAAGSADAFCCQATAEREAFAYFAPTPICSLAPARIFFAEGNPNADAIRAARSREDLFRFKTAGLIGDSRDDAIWRHHPQRMLVSDTGAISRMLATGHADFVLAEPIVMQFKLQELGLLGKVMSIPGEYLTDAQETQVRFWPAQDLPRRQNDRRTDR